MRTRPHCFFGKDKRDLPKVYQPGLLSLKSGSRQLRVQIPIRLRSINHLETESPDRSRNVCLLRNGSLGRSRQVDLLATLDWQIPKQAEI